MKRFLIIYFVILLILSGCDLLGIGKDINFSEKTIFFASYRIDGEIYAMTPDGKGQEKIIDHGIYPRVSPDQSKIVYVSFTDGDGEIWISSIDGSNKIKLTDNQFEENRPVFSHGGSRILFETNRNGNYDLYTMDLSGGHLIQITDSTSDEKRGEFSPDDSRITYTGGSFSTIYVSDADGQNAAAILPGDFFWSWGSHWAPDGTELVFTAYYGDTFEPYNGIYTVKLDGSDPQALYTAENAQEAYFSPDGTELVFVGFEGNKKQIFKIDSSTGNLTQILSVDYDCFQPYWIW